MLSSPRNMFNTIALLVLFCSPMMLETSGLEVSLDRSFLPHKEGAPCSQLVCRVTGNSASVKSVTMSKVKVNGDPSELLAVTADAPEMDISVDTIRGNGTLRDNSAILYVDLSNISSCQSEYVTCEISYTTESGQSEQAFSIAGPGKPSTFTATTQTHRENLLPVQEARPTRYKTGSPFLSELWFLGEKITKVEGKFETLSDRLDRRLSQNIDAVQSRAGTLENSVLERVSSVETDFSSRVSRLEDRVSSILLSESPDTSSDVALSLAHMERRLDDMRTELDQMNQSRAVYHGDQNQEEQPVLCERGMGFDVTKSYPAYITMPHKTINRQILCDTHTDGGGWIIFQRRTKGDLDFYRNWTSYKNGFGSIDGDFWLGNDVIHKLTDEHPYELRVDMRYQSKGWFAEYSSFRIDDELNKYRLHLGSPSGPAQNGKTDLSYHKNGDFSTFDRDNDLSSANCAVNCHGAWWYKDCKYTTLNGLWDDTSAKGVYWYTGSVPLYPYFTEMKIRKVKTGNTD